MMKNILPTLSVFVVILMLTASCATKPHPNEKILVGTWKVIKAEKIVDSTDVTTQGTANKTVQKRKDAPVKSQGEQMTGAKKSELIDRFIRSEMNSTIQILPNKTAIRTFRGKENTITWKMKGKGTRVILKNPELDRTFILEILSINKEEIVAMISSPMGEVKMTYQKIK